MCITSTVVFSRAITFHNKNPTTINDPFFHVIMSIAAVSMVDQKTLENFVVCFSENQEHCKELTITDSILHLEEYILKVSGLIKTDFGTGRIALTVKR